MQFPSSLAPFQIQLKVSCDSQNPIELLGLFHSLSALLLQKLPQRFEHRLPALLCMVSSLFG